MNPDDYDFFRHLKKEQTPNVAVDLIKSLDDRNYGHFKKNVKSKECRELYAEEELIRKEKYDELRCEMPGLPRSTFLMVFSPDGTKVASTHGDHNIYVTDIRSGKNVKTLVGHPRTPWCIAFHPSSNQIVASGCLGGQVRIWDLSGGSEVWTASNLSVIASIAFHPNDRVLVIATFNEVYFWDWSKPEPFCHAATGNHKEKVRYVAFDKLGHKLITGIANSPQTRWERVRAPVPVPRQVERSAGPYRRRITPRLFNNTQARPSEQSPVPSTSRESTSTVPERERNITVCYRNLVREYGRLVQRYLQLYRPPIMIDRGTDPMETAPSRLSLGTQTLSEQPSTSSQPEPSTSSGPSTSAENDQTSQNRSSPPNPYHLLTPSRIFAVMNRPTTLIRGTQTTEAKKHKAEESAEPTNVEKKPRIQGTGGSPMSRNTQSVGENSQSSKTQVQNEIGTQTQNPMKFLVISTSRPIKKSPGGIGMARMSVNSEFQASLSSMPIAARKELLKSINLPPNRDNSATSGTQTSIPVPVVTETNSQQSILNSNGTQGVSAGPQTESVATQVPTIPPSNSILTEDEGDSVARTRCFMPLGSADCEPNLPSTSKSPFKILCRSKDRTKIAVKAESSSNDRCSEEGGTGSTGQQVQEGAPQPDTNRSGDLQNVEQLMIDIRRDAAEEVRNRILPIIQSVPENDRLELMRLFEHGRESIRMRVRQIGPLFIKKPNRRPVLDTSSESSSSDDERNTFSSRFLRRNSDPDMITSPIHSNNNLETINPTTRSDIANVNGNTSQQGPTNYRNYNTELEQLVTSLLVEIERSENQATTTTQASSSTTMTQVSSANVTLSQVGVDSQPVSSPSINTIVPSLQRNCANVIAESCRKANTSTTSNTDNSTSTSNLPSSAPNTNTRTTNSTIYTSGGYWRRRYCAHRASAFTPTRVYYPRTPPEFRRNRHFSIGRWRMNSRPYRLNNLSTLNNNNNNFALDEVINYSERPNSEDEPTSSPYLQFHPFDPPPELPAINPENIGIGNMYSNIVQDLETSLNDVRNIRATNRPGEMSDMLSSFSERLENIMNQSETILRNLRSSMEMLPAQTDSSETRQGSSEPSVSFNDQSFYVRDQRVPSASDQAINDLDRNLAGIFGESSSVIPSDHTYPRNPDSPQTPTNSNDTMSPLMTSLHFTISHIQRQARLLRQQVESIERIDRAMVEVAQLQLIRLLLVELSRYVRNLNGESRSTCMSSVRQMMAGTRISDSSPGDSPAEDTQQQPPVVSQPSTSTAPSESNNVSSIRPRGSHRKTYPPSRLSRLQRQLRRTTVIHYLPRRCILRPDRGFRMSYQPRNVSRPTSSNPLNLDAQSLLQYSRINSFTLNRMTRRLDELINDQVRSYSPLPNTSTSTAPIGGDTGEQQLALRLRDSISRTNRLVGTIFDANVTRNRTETTAVSRDGIGRFCARQTLSYIIDGISLHLEETRGSTIPQNIRVQIQGVMTMSLLLSELLLLQIVDSIPPPTEMDLDQERQSLTNRIDQMCSLMLSSRYTGYSQQLNRSLRLMRVTMRQTNALGRTFISRRHVSSPNRGLDRVQLLGTINRSLRILNRTLRARSNNPPLMNTTPEPTIENNVTQEENTTTVAATLPVTSTPAENSNSVNWLDNLSDRLEVDDNEDSQYNFWFNTTNSNSSIRNSSLYRSSNVNLAPTNSTSPGVSRTWPWSVPSVQVNDVPVSEPSNPITHHQITHRFAERVSELRTNPSLGLFRPRFLHPWYASVNPFDADLDDPQRDHIYDSDMVTTVTPNHRIQVWDISEAVVPVISNPLKNVVVSECKIHNDASVDIASDGSILVTLLPSGGYLNVTNRLGVYSLRWETLGQCLYTTNFDHNAVSVSLSPLSRHLIVGLASRRVSIVPSERWTMARIFKIEQKDMPGDRLPVVRELEQNRDGRATNHKSVNCIRWLPISGQGLIYATNTGQLVILT